jgi:hypothetical protein
MNFIGAVACGVLAGLVFEGIFVTAMIVAFGTNSLRRFNDPKWFWTYAAVWAAAVATVTYAFA